MIQERKKFWNIALIIRASNFYFHNITPRSNQFENNSISYKLLAYERKEEISFQIILYRVPITWNRLTRRRNSRAHLLFLRKKEWSCNVRIEVMKRRGTPCVNGYRTNLELNYASTRAKYFELVPSDIG